jgi:hypothetical protein
MTKRNRCSAHWKRQLRVRGIDRTCTQTPFFDADDPAEAERRFRDVVARHKKAAPQIAAWLEENVP